MVDVRICKDGDIADPGRKVFRIEEHEVGIYKISGAYFGYYNICPHASGPACQGVIVPLTLEAACEDRTSDGRVFSETETNIVCPWHGFEFNVRTGEHPTDRRYKLKAVPVTLRGDDVFISIP